MFRWQITSFGNLDATPLEVYFELYFPLSSVIVLAACDLRKEVSLPVLVPKRLFGRMMF